MIKRLLLLLSLVALPSSAFAGYPFDTAGDKLTHSNFIADEQLTFTSSVAPLITVTTSASTTPNTVQLYVPAGYDAMRVWTGEQPVTEAGFDLYMKRNGGTTIDAKLFPYTARILQVASGEAIAISTVDGRSLQVSFMDYPTALLTPSGVTGTANADNAGPPFWSPSAPHVTLPSNNSAFQLNSDGTERKVFISEQTPDGSWTPVRFVVLPSATNVKVQATYSRIALANYDGASLSVTAPTGSTVGGTSTTMAFTQTATGTTCTASNNTQWNTCVSTVVAGDEIVVDTSFTLGSNLTDNSFTANEIAGRQGAEGIIIRSATGNPADVTLVLADNSNGWALQQVGATQYTFIKGITFDLSGRAAYLNNQGGKFRYQDVRITGNSTSTTSPSLAMDSSQGAIMFDAIRVQVDDCVEDCFDGNGTGSDSGSTSIIRLADCIGFDSGTTNDNQQVITTHNGQRIQVYGGNFYDARLSVVACDGNAASVVHMFFSDTSDGAAGRRAGLSDISGYFITSDSSQADGISPDPGAYLIGVKATRDGFIAGSSLLRYSASTDVPANISIIANNFSVNNGRAIFPSVGGGTYQFNIIVSTSGEGMRLANFAAGGSTANSNFYNNTFLSSAIALSYGDTSLPSVLRNNACSTNTNSIAGVTAAIDATIDGDYNVFDPTVDVDYTPGANDITNANAALDSNNFPTDGGNSDSSGDTTTYSSVGWIDICAFSTIYKASVASRGARTIAELVSGAELLPDLYL